MAACGVVAGFIPLFPAYYFPVFDCKYLIKWSTPKVLRDSCSIFGDNRYLHYAFSLH